MQGLMKIHGKSILQKDFRDRINYVKRKSNWKDAELPNMAANSQKSP